VGLTTTVRLSPGWRFIFFGAAAGDHTFDLILADVDDDVRHRVAEFHVFDLAVWHGFAKKGSRDFQFAATVMFIQKHLLE
jgi:hypothetical protein